MSMFVRKVGYNNNNSSNNKPNLPPGEKACGHNHCLLTINKCCACSDKRPKNGGYTKYVDGQGFVSATRSEHYCPKCRDHSFGPQPPPVKPKFQHTTTPLFQPSSPPFKFQAPAPAPPPAPPPAPSPAPTLSEFQMLASITEMGFSYPDALKALVTLKASSRNTPITPELLLNAILEDTDAPLPPPPSPPPPARAPPPTYPSHSSPFSFPSPFPPPRPPSPPGVIHLPFSSLSIANNNNNNAPPNSNFLSPAPVPVPALAPVTTVTTTVTHVTPVTPVTHVTPAVRNSNPNGNNETSCIVCFNNPINSVMVPCGHLAMCFTCAKAVKRIQKDCPVCRQEISAVYQTFHV